MDTERFDLSPLAAVLLAVAALALALRLFALGYRVFYYDEAWFGYWVLKFLDTGVWWYRPTMHGPFFVRVNAIVFSLLGVSDATGRLVVALMGGLFPLSAWLFRERLRDAAVVALAVILAVNPLLLYYSRFMRKDFPLAAAMLVTLGLVVRLADTGRTRYLYGAAFSLGVAFGTKESVLLWLVTWLGAGLIVLDYRLVGARWRGSSPGALLGDVAARVRHRGREWLPHVVGSGLLCLAVVVYFYAPRGGGRPNDGVDIGLWMALTGDVASLPAVVGEATIGTFQAAIDHWVHGAKQDHPYLPYLTDTLKTLRAGAAGVLLLAVLGYAADRYGEGGPRALVEFNFYCGVLATVGYPIANFLPVPWSTTHAVVPFAVPAAVGAGVVYRWGWRGGTSARDAVGGVTGGLGSPGLPRSRLRHATRAGLATGLLVLLLASASATAYQTSYVAPHDSPVGPTGNEIIYYAQPPAELRTGIEAIERAAASGGPDTDVLYVGRAMAMNETKVRLPPETGAWHRRMPLPWYTEAAGADVASVGRVQAMGADPPPVVITPPGKRGIVAQELGDAYTATHYDLDEAGDRQAVFFVHESIR